MRPLTLLRTLATSASATAVGLFNVVAGGGEGRPVELGPGDMAPDFELPGSDGRVHRLRDSRGEAVVLAWFPKAFTTVCTRECESIGQSAARLRLYRARCFGISADRVGTSRAFAQSMGVEYPILSDPGGVLARAYGVIRSTGFPERWTFYIGSDGRILEIDKHVRAGSHGDDIAARLDALKVPRQGVDARRSQAGPEGAPDRLGAPNGQAGAP